MEVRFRTEYNQSLSEPSIIKAYQNRSELQQNLAERNIAEFQRRAAFSGLRPQISLTANYQLEDRFDDNESNC